jgi:tetratricopeptide (TPR) repeat protein
VDTARRLPPSGISSPVHYVQVMATLFHAHSSGRFTLHGQTARRTIYLLNGYPVWVSVSEPMEGLPRYLLEERLLDREGVAALDRWAAAHDGQVRGGLVEMGLMAAADLPPVMENWVAYEVRGALGHRGPYQFAPGDDFAGSIPVYEVNPIRAIWEGLAEHLAVDEVRRDLDALAGRSLGRTRTFNRLFGYVATSPALRELGESLLRPRTVQELRERFSDRDGQISRCLWFLVHAGLVALSDAPDLRRGETGTAAAVQPPGAGAGDAAESRVTGGMRAVAVDAPRPVEASRGADGPRVAAAAAPPAQAPPPPPPSWLEAAPTAPGMGAVPGGRTPSSSSMSSIQALPPGRSGLGVPAAEVEVAFETARYGRDAVERLRVAAAQRSGEAAKPGGPPEDPEASIVRDYVVRMDLDHYGFLGIPPNSSSEDVDAAYQSLAPRYRLRTLGAEVQGETRRKAKELLARLVAAYKELSDPERRKHYDALLARRAREERAPAALSSSTGSMRSVQDVEREVSGAAATVGADSDISPVLEGEIPAAGWYPGHGEAAALQRRVDKLGMLYGPLLREAHEAMEQGDWAQAHSRLEELRTRYPSDPGILTDLGWCRFAHSPTEARSIDKALEWVELALAFTPEHRGALEARARILMTTERHEDAVQALQRVRKLAPDAVWIQNAIEEREELLAAAAAAAAGGGREGGERGKGGGLLGGLLGRRKG